MGQPWLVEDIANFYHQNTIAKRTKEDIRLCLEKHFQEILYYKNDRKALGDFRRVASWFLKQCSHVNELKMAIIREKDPAKIYQALMNFSWESVEYTPKEVNG